MISATLDSNVLVSALEFGGIPLRLLNLARAGAFRLDVSDALLNEVGRVLHEKFGWPVVNVREFREEIEGFANLVSPKEVLPIVRADPADDKIVECAAAARSDYFVTGDHHLLDLVSHLETRIIKPAAFLELGRSR